MTKAFIQTLTPDCIVLTANSRLTRYLQATFDEYQQSLRQSTWETAQILPLQSWLQQQFHQNNPDDLILLSDFQEQCIWESIIEQSPIASELLHPAQLSKSLKGAWKILTQWQLSLDVLEPYQTQVEVEYLIEWINIFQEQCKEKKWITTAELPHHIKTKDTEKSLTLPNRIILMGFDDLNPSLKSLFAQFEKRIVIETVELKTPSHTQRIILEDTETELLTMAKWVKAHWQKNPAAQLGCVVPELGKMRTQVERVFSAVFNGEKVFNISAGIPLSNHNMIHSALTVLNWCCHPLSIQALAPLLQSPYLCANEIDACVGAQLDALLREQNRLQISIADLYSVIPKLKAHYPDNQALSRWHKLLQFSREKKSAQLIPSEWAKQFIELLKTIQWPGVRTQTSDEFQALERFKKLLMEFSQLDLLLSEINFSRALHLLKSLSQQTIFQPKSHHEPIQIMGALEASGIVFDAMWVMGLHDGIWPPATKPHPLIPYNIQQQYQMPHATAERELQFCEHITRRLENSANHVVFSSPEKEGDQLLFPSQLIQPISLITTDELILDKSKNASEKLFCARKMESLIDHQANHVSDFSHIHGGSTILKLQAQCPFRAFATIRLKANTLNEPTLGIPVVTKGIIIHHILFELWCYLKDQKTLQSLSDEILDALIQEKIERTFSTLLAKLETNENAYFLAVEKKRLRALIKNWLTLEKSRPAFRVKALEESCQIMINQLPLKIRLDRVDELDDGSLLLIDYKTGKTEIATLLQERLTNPQLPIYAVFQGENKQRYDGVAFAQVRNAQMIFRGLSNEKQAYEKNKQFHFTPIHQTKNELQIDNWDSLLGNWKKSLEKLSNDFCSGDAIANPIEPTICETCDLKSMCRYIV